MSTDEPEHAPSPPEEIGPPLLAPVPLPPKRPQYLCKIPRVAHDVTAPEKKNSPRGGTPASKPHERRGGQIETVVERRQVDEARTRKREGKSRVISLAAYPACLSFPHKEARRAAGSRTTGGTSGKKGMEKTQGVLWKVVAPTDVGLVLSSSSGNGCNTYTHSTLSYTALHRSRMAINKPPPIICL